MEKAVLMMDYLNVTQGANGGFSHKGDCALDLAGKDTGRDDLRAPFTGTIKRIYEKCNAVWLQSNEKVKYADGTEDYMTLLTFHDNSVTSLKVGKVIKQGEVFYQEGTKGYATGNHIHLTISKGKYSGNGWHENEYGNWVANNQYDVYKALFLDAKTKIKNDGGYKWVKTDSYVIDTITPNVEKDKYKNQVEVVVTELRVRKQPNLKGEILGYAKVGLYNVLEEKEADGYLWVKIADNQWIATKDEWTKIYPAVKKETSKKKYLNLQPSVSSWTVYKTNNYYTPSKSSDVLIKLNPKKYGGLTYEILEDMGNYHFKIKTSNKGLGYIAGNPNKYSCTITNEPVYENGNY